jgi:hypothetical protein
MTRDDLAEGATLLFSSSNPLRMGESWYSDGAYCGIIESIVKIEFFGMYKNLPSYRICDIHLMNSDVKEKYLCNIGFLSEDAKKHNGILKPVK